MYKQKRQHNTYRTPSMPYLKGEISLGYDDSKRDTLRIDGPLVPSMKQIIKKYGIPPQALFSFTVWWVWVLAVLISVTGYFGVMA